MYTKINYKGGVKLNYERYAWPIKGLKPKNGLTGEKVVCKDQFFPVTEKIFNFVIFNSIL